MPLILDLLRHGEAAPSAVGGDDDRPLTARGERAILDLARRLERERGRPGRVFSSPIKRARDTAAILIQSLGLTLAAEELDALMPESDPAELLDALAAHEITSGHVVLVGHQPLMGRLVELLSGSAPGIKPGELVRIELRDGIGPRRGRILGSFRPE